jgi:hypothetical protein
MKKEALAMPTQQTADPIPPVTEPSLPVENEE